MTSRPVVLIGLPGAGKTTVGRVLAQQLELPFIDVDEAVERRLGLPVPEIFARLGEAAFRRAEMDEMTALLAGEPAVIAAGGGWAAIPGAIAAARRGAAGPVIVYLQVSPEVAAERLGTATDRPLLNDGGRLERLGELLAARAASYKEADLTVVAEGRSPAEVGSEIAGLVTGGSRYK